jgi:hypothetical protein
VLGDSYNLSVILIEILEEMIRCRETGLSLYFGELIIPMKGNLFLLTAMKLANRMMMFRMHTRLTIICKI